MDRDRLARLVAAGRRALLSDAGVLIVFAVLVTAGIAGLLVLDGDKFLGNH